MEDFAWHAKTSDSLAFKTGDSPFLRYFSYYLKYLIP